MLPFLMVIDMKRSSRERPWPVAWPEDTARESARFPRTDQDSWTVRGARSGQPDRDGAFKPSATRPSDLRDVRSAAVLAALDSAADPDAGRAVRGR